ncbi:glutaminyl-peptide cyclotransferase [Drosophila eugracilis]|uniref:glutaminyl-peptide cyclotransferase n=1 Tax=Drosophila eugracilis TaxID=29029 RepID=UPI0007E8AC8B|nr:glutaminyl-peptide cyclotransferase [Drosophila eugracilis]
MPCSGSFLEFIFLTIILFILLICQNIQGYVLSVGHNGTLTYKPSELSLSHMQYLAGLSDPTDLRQHVQRISVKRVVDTPGHAIVRNYIVDYLRKLKWNVELDIFQQKVPILGNLTFQNIVAKKNPKAQRNLMLGCHYDSKYFKNFNFVAATDSAVSCALLLNMAKILNDRLKSSEISLMLVFFDGEEAFEKWSETDSLYGSRHLAKVWEDKGFLGKIDLFLLLDLIGAKNLSFKNYLPDTSEWYNRFVQLEKKLAKAGILNLEHHLFKSEFGQDSDDDHLPFIRRNVSVVHLIAEKYPAVWHQAEDVERNVDYNVTEQFGLVLRMFLMEYLNFSATPFLKSIY